MGNSGFGSSTTAEEVARDISLKDRVIVVTGANEGLGKETTRVLAKMGATVVMAARRVEKSKEAIDEILKQNKDAKLIPLALDLSSFESVNSFVAEFKKLNLPLHIIIANAGVISNTLKKTKDDLEYCIGVNHFGHFSLIVQLLPIMVESCKETEGRIVMLSSAGHALGSGVINYDNLNFEKEGSYGLWYSYGQSKLANIMFSNELNRKLEENKINIRSNSLHPGQIKTELQNELPDLLKGFMNILGTFTYKTIEQGAATTIYCATAPELKGVGGKYFDNCQDSTSSALKYAFKPEETKKFWDLSEKVTNVKFELK